MLMQFILGSVITCVSFITFSISLKKIKPKTPLLQNEQKGNNDNKKWKEWMVKSTI